MSLFTHLHVHTQYSILDGQANIKKLVSYVKGLGMNSLAITDHGSMFGVYEFFSECKKQGIKPIIGCEVYITDGSRFSKDRKEDRSGYHLVLLAKNQLGYSNLSKLVSIGHLEGFYYTPRIDFEVLEKYSEGIIAASACLGGEIPQEIMRSNLSSNQKVDVNNLNLITANQILDKYLAIFGDDFYLELQRHGRNEQEFVNQALVKMARDRNVKMIATNDTHFIRKEDYEAHNVLICLNTNRELDDTDSMHYTGNEFVRTIEEMKELFADLPEVIGNTQEIVNKVETFDLNREILLPIFEIPEGFEDQQAYLEHITWEGAKKRWGELTPEITERLEFELSVVKNMGFPGYFLIVWDFIKKAREMGVRVGPGRGSAAGSAVAYAIEITGIDPIKYQLLFERFLNPERISMPDVDIDFDDEKRDLVLKYVVEKYGQEKVAQIITFGSMAAKSAIKDVCRILKIPLQESVRLSKLIPDGAGKKLDESIKEVPELKLAYETNKDYKRMLDLAMNLEGSVRNTGVHACGVIIAPDDLTKFVPISRAKDSESPVTQYDGKIVESVGLLKMDFLGLKTLSIINDTLYNIKKRHQTIVDVDKLDLEDSKTFELFSKGNTTAIFQFESDGMRKYLIDLEPSRFEDIIAMNALYRPGPLSYIPDFIKRKHGVEKISYDLPEMEEYLADTYGITVYQEQVMLLSQKIAGFSKGEADTLRKAMGKKQADVLAKMKSKFIEGAKANGHPEKVLEKIWKDWEAFAHYAFNKSHSTCYGFIAFQTAYLKAHYMAEFMAANLTHNLSKIEEISKLIEDCRKNSIEVLGPDVLESELKFTVNQKGQIRFGLAAIKGVGEAAVEDIIRERTENGPFSGVLDFMTRINLRSCNKRCIEALAKAGAFDCFPEIHRAQFFFEENGNSFLEKLIRYATNISNKADSAQVSLFDMDESESDVPDIEFPSCPEWNAITKLKFEQEVTGFYISGHPLDEYKFALKFFARNNIGELKDTLAQRKLKEMKIGGIISSATHAVSAKGSPWGRFIVEDYTGSHEITLFGDQYLDAQKYMNEGMFVFIHLSVVPPLKWKLEKDPNAELDIKINKISLLSDVLQNTCKQVEIEIYTSAISEGFLNDFEQTISKHQGVQSLIIFLKDKESGYKIKLKSNKYKVNCVTLVDELEKMGIDFELK
jgi:DNA polymerase-3 subunit alpha